MTTASVVSSAVPSDVKRRRRRRWRRKTLAGLGLLVLALLTLWIAVHRVRWLGPWLADAGRGMFGERFVATLEDWAYAADDAWNRLTRRGEQPRAQWPVPARVPPPVSSATPALAFQPADVGPVHERFAAPGDGVWVPVPDERHPEQAPLLYKTLLHPDEHRAWAELFVVAIDRVRVRLRLVAGTVDPEAMTSEGKLYHRSGLIPLEDQDALVAAFNGGFKTEHGHFGMRVDGVTLIPARDDVCTLAALADESIRIAPWKAVAAEEPHAVWWRQTPPCMVERDVLHDELAGDGTKRWGAAVGGETVIRRSAIGLSEHADTLYVGVSDSTTAGVIARGMRHAGAWDVAQLDVNWSYPKFLVFRTGASGSIEAVGLFPGFVFERDEYARHPAPKDFFYVLRR
jgi:hypothetical protein